MIVSVPPNPKIYHIVHVDRLASIIADGFLWSDAESRSRVPPGTVIGMNSIKGRRLTIPLDSHPGLHVGECVPFFFCPRSIMLYVLYRANNPELTYRGGQSPIIHLQCDLNAVVSWAHSNNRRWAFTLSNAASAYFEDRNDIGLLHELDWAAINATNWQSCSEGKQAEFLSEQCFPWHLVESIGVQNATVYGQVVHQITTSPHKPVVALQPSWYY